jgi:hypothetical protein
MVQEVHQRVSPSRCEAAEWTFRPHDDAGVGGTRDWVCHEILALMMSFRAAGVPTAIRVAGLVACVLAGLSFVLAVLVVRQGSPELITEVEVGIDAAALEPWRGGYYGVVDRGLPAYELSWDGTPPRAEIIDRRTHEILASSVLARSTLEANRNAVLWLPADAEQLTAERCEFVLDERLVAARGSALSLRLEVPTYEQTSRRWTLLGVVLAVGAAVLLAAASLVAASSAQRAASLLRSCRTGVFLALASTCLLIHFPNVPWLNAETDAASINSFAAALDHPDAFTRDGLLDEQEDFDWYIPAFVSLVRATRVLGLPYHAAYAWLGFLGVWLSLVGYERLFSRISGSAIYGSVAALAIGLLGASYPPNEHWSFAAVLPRSIFAALLPWVLLLGFRWLGPRPAASPRYWWIAAGAAAGLFYIHPVSSPALSAALLVAFLTCPRVSWSARLAGVAAASLVTALIMLPYATRYEGARRGGADGSESLQVLRSIVAPFEPHRFYAAALDLILQTPRYWLLLAGIALVAATARSGRRVFLAMLAGWALVTLLVPELDWVIATSRNRQPFQFNLVRNLRYLDVWLLATLAMLVRTHRQVPLAPLWVSARIAVGRSTCAARSRIPAVALIASALVVLCYSPSAARTVTAVVAQVGASRAAFLGRWRSVPSSRLELLRAVEAFRRPDEAVLVPRDLDFFRQLLIPLAYTWKDPETLSYAAGVEMVEADRVVRRVAELLEPPVDGPRVAAAATESGAGLVVIERWRTTLALRESPDRLFLNDRYVLVRPSSPLHGRTPSRPSP